MRVREEVPGSWKGARGRRETGEGIRVTGGGKLVTGWEGREKGKVRKGASGLPDVGSAGTGGDGMICPPAVCTKTPLSPQVFHIVHPQRPTPFHPIYGVV